MTQTDLAAMPVAERIRMMEALWESLTAGGTLSDVVPAWHADVLRERGEQLDSGVEPISDWAEAKQRLRKQTAGE